MLRPYFKIENVIRGIFGLANKLYSITFKRRTETIRSIIDVKAYKKVLMPTVLPCW